MSLGVCVAVNTGVAIVMTMNTYSRCASVLYDHLKQGRPGTGFATTVSSPIFHMPSFPSIQASSSSASSSLSSTSSAGSGMRAS